MNGSPRGNQKGQSLVLLMAFLAVCVTLLLGLFTLSLTVREKIRLQMGADLAVLSALNVQAETLNAIALGNRAILANDALCAQLNAVVSEVTFYRKMMDQLAKIVRFIPYVGPFLAMVMENGGEAAETLSRKSASLLIPMAGRSDALTEREQDLLMLSLSYRSLSAAEASRDVTVPQADFHPLAKTILLGGLIQRLRAIQPLSADEIDSLQEKTLDRHTRRRDWSARVAGFRFPIRKQGGTSVAEDDFRAFDNLRVRVLRKLRWRWKTVLSASSRASDFGYRRHGRILDLTDRNKPWSLTLAMESKLPQFPFLSTASEARVVAVSSGRLVYRRESRPDESPNLLNPFWGATLMPVGDDPLAKRIVPGILLREVRH